MKLDNHQLDRLRKIISKTLSGSNDWLKNHNIRWGNKEPFHILNYGPGQRNDHNSLVRGLVLRRDKEFDDPIQNIVSFPFVRFFNFGEGEAAPVDFSNAEMVEKMDGTMVGTFWHEGKIFWHTRQMVSAYKPDMALKIKGFHGGNYEFMPLIGSFVEDLNWSEQDKRSTYVFEFIHEASMVWTKYTEDKFGLYLLGGRNLDTLMEYSENELDMIAARLGCFRPRRWDSINDHDKIHAMMKEICLNTPDFEGFVFRCRETGNRVKLKDPDYVKFHHMLDKMSYKRLIPLVLAGETEEVVAYFPHAKERCEILEKKIGEFVDSVHKKCLYWRDEAANGGWTRKRVAAEVFSNESGQPKFVTRTIMRWFEEKDDEVILNGIKKDFETIAVGRDGNSGSAKAVLEILNLDEIEEESVGEI